MADDTTSTVNIPQIPRLRDPQYRELYSNAILTNLGAFDITIIFQKISEFVPGQMGATDQVSVTMSPQHFKALVRSVNEILIAYQSAFGELSITNDYTTPARTASEIEASINQAKISAKPSLSSSESKQATKKSRGAH